MKIPHKQEFQQIAINHSSDTDLKDLIIQQKYQYYHQVKLIYTGVYIYRCRFIDIYILWVKKYYLLITSQVYIFSFGKSF